jgi:uncharacterized lipoprotein YddW (UPF0748 family)
MKTFLSLRRATPATRVRALSPTTIPSSVRARSLALGCCLLAALLAFAARAASSPNASAEEPSPFGGARFLGAASPGDAPSGDGLGAVSLFAGDPIRSIPASNARPAARAADGAGPMRAVWVTRWNYESPADVERIVANCAAAGATTIFFQARGAGTAFYRSRIEPWAFELTSKTPATTGKNPGWDPLATAVAAARRHGIGIHAYINLLPGWRATTSPPASAGQLWTRHPEWFAVDSGGRRMDPAKWYSFLDPALPEVRQYLATLAAELVRNYAVDGLHLDYVRYPGDHGDYGFGARSLQLYRSTAGAKAQPSGARWDAWRAKQVERMVGEVARAAKAVRPGLVVSAAVFADEEAATKKHAQRSWEWPLGGSGVDAIIPMNYATNYETYKARASFFAKRVNRDRLAMGLLSEHSIDAQRRRIAYAKSLGLRHVAFFAYGDLFPDHRPGPKAVLLRE